MSLLSQFFPGGSAGEGFIDLEVLMVGGGGGGGAGAPNLPTPYPGGGGGGGGIYYGVISAKLGSVCPISVGGGGAGGASTPGPGSYGNSGIRGGTTSFTCPVGTYRAAGGGGAKHFGDPIGPANVDGGCGGGCGRGPLPAGKSYYRYGTADASYLQYNIPFKNGGYYGCPGGASPVNVGTSGGGSAVPGSFTSPSPNYFNFGSDISGTYTTYSEGGVANLSTPGTPTTAPSGAANSGNGGAAGSGVPGNPLTGGNGGSGVLIVRYPTAFAAAPSFPGATDLSPSTPGFRTYQFTSSGSITLPS